jgi:hypothetical protein
MGFTRGDQTIELLAKDPTMTGGCTPGDLYTPSVEKNFIGWTG